jgi:hypothetical protein
MKSLIAFWRKDIINKLILLVSLGLVVGIGAIGWLIFHMPEGRSFSDAFADFLPATPTPAFDPSRFFTPIAPAGSTATALPVPLSPAASPTVTPTLMVEATPTVEESAVVSPTPVMPSSGDALSCLPENTPRQQGRVLEILDGNTIRVLINGLVYPVRYIGVSEPENKAFKDVAAYQNAELVYGRDITLIEDAAVAEADGRLLRYVLVGDTFVNLELLRLGLGSVVEVPSGFSCLSTFKQTEQAAKDRAAGIWAMPLPPVSP